MPRCGLYVRVSTAMQAAEEEGSLKSQVQRLQEEMKRRSRNGEPWVETKVYVEEGASGKDLNRPKFIEMVKDIKEGKIDTVICTELSRVSRSVIDFLNFTLFLQNYKAGFLCLKQQFDSTTPHGRILITICVALAEFERELTSDRTSENMLARARRGLRNGTQVLGLDIDPSKKGYLIPNEAEKPVVNLAFDKYLETGSGKEVTKFLNANGYKTKSYTAKNGRVHHPHKFGTSSVHYLLTNRAYIGEVEINRMNRAKDQTSLPEKDRYAVVKAVWAPIVPEEKFWAVQRLMRENGQQRKNLARKVIHNYILRGLVQCGTCGSFLEDGSGTSKSGRLFFYYRHKSGARKDGCCPSSLRAEALEKIVQSRLSYLAERQDIIEAISQTANENLAHEVPKVMSLLEKRKKEYARLARELETWTQKVLDLDNAQIKELVVPKINDLKQQQEQVNGEIGLLRKSLDELKGNAVSVIEIQETLQSFRILYAELQPHKQRELLGYIIKSISITPTEIRLALFGRANLEQFTLADGVFAQHPNWLPN